MADPSDLLIDRTLVLLRHAKAVPPETMQDFERPLAEASAAVLVASSDLEDLQAVCDTVGVVQAGSIGPLHPIMTLDDHDWEALV